MRHDIPQGNNQIGGIIRYRTVAPNRSLSRNHGVFMKTQKQDRRSQRTQRMLAEALVALMLERRYADITVQDLLDRADVGRSTFYAHYWDKDDLLASEVERMLSALDRQMVAATHGEADLLPVRGLFQHVGEFHALYQALGRGQELEIVVGAMRKRLCEVVESRLAAMAPADMSAMMRTITAQSVVGAVLALLQWWVEAEIPVSARQMEAYYRQLALPGVRQLLATSGQAGGVSS
jgi:AcrR family transcriptional regulator